MLLFHNIDISFYSFLFENSYHFFIYEKIEIEKTLEFRCATFAKHWIYEVSWAGSSFLAWIPSLRASVKFSSNKGERRHPYLVSIQHPKKLYRVSLGKVHSYSERMECFLKERGLAPESTRISLCISVTETQVANKSHGKRKNALSSCWKDHLPSTWYWKMRSLPLVTSPLAMLVRANHFKTFPSELFSDYPLLKRIQIGGFALLDTPNQFRKKGVPRAKLFASVSNDTGEVSRNRSWCSKDLAERPDWEDQGKGGFLQVGGPIESSGSGSLPLHEW